MKNKISSILINLTLFIIATITISPLLWMLFVSFMPSGSSSSYPPPFLPNEITIEHYKILFTKLNLLNYFLNSLVLSISISLISVLVNSMAGFAFAKLFFPHKDKLFRFLLASLVVPGQVTMLPLFFILNKLGFINTYWGLIIPGMASIFGIFLIKQYLYSIPDTLIEAARIDGASDFTIYYKIILPLCKPILVTLTIFTFIGTWNDFLWPLIIMTDDSMYTLPVALANLMGEHALDTELMMAGSVLTTLPIIILFMFLQRYYIEGITAGSIKE